MLHSLLQDLRYAFRGMRANPVFTTMALLSLALGIGANTAIYSLMDAVLARSLPVKDPSSLVLFRWHITGRAPVVRSLTGSNWDDGKHRQISGNLPYFVFETLGGESPYFSTVFGFNSAWRTTVVIQGQGTVLNGLFVSGGFFNGLGVAPAAGRLIGPEDDRASATPVAIVSYSFAERRFGQAANALGQLATINNVPFTIAGVAPRGFFGVSPGEAQDFYLPMHSSLLVDRSGQQRDPAAKYADRNFYWIELMGRLRPGITLAQAQSALAPTFHNLILGTASTEAERAEIPELSLEPGGGGLEALRRQFSKPLYVLLTMVGIILAIACANLANLLLARSAARRREMAVRLSVGAGRARIVRQLLTESVLLAGLGAALGVAFAAWAIRALTALMAGGRQNFVLEAGLNWRVLAAATALALATGILFGFAPALQSARVDLATALKQTRAGEGRWRFRSWLRVSPSQALVVTQIAASLLLSVGAGLFLRTMHNLNSVELGFNREHLLLFTLNARQAGYEGVSLTRFYQSLQARLAGLPGVRAVTASSFPLVGQYMSSTLVTLPGRTGPAGQTSTLAVAPDFFSTMEIPLLLGRPIDHRDVDGSRLVAVVNEIFVKKHLEGENPLGVRFMLGRGNPEQIEIIGVARSARYNTLKNEIPPLAYIPYNQNGRYFQQLTFELRAAGDPLALANSVREAVRQADSRIPVTEIKTQQMMIDETIGQERAFAMLCTTFAGLAVLIACVGLYGTMAYAVARRTNELGLRMALGAQRRRLIWMVLREVLGMSAAGLAVGLPLAFWLSRFVKSFLFGMKPVDPLALSGAVAVLIVATVAAGYGPAWRASRIDPWTALRDE